MPKKKNIKGVAVGSSKKVYTVKGFTGTLEEIASYFGINLNTLRTRMYKGMSLLEAVTLPVDKSRSIKTAAVHHIGSFTGDSDACNNWFGVIIPPQYRPRTDEVVTFIKKYEAPVFYPVGNKYKGTLKAISEDFGIPESKLVKGLRDGFSPLKVLEQNKISVEAVLNGKK